MNDAVRMFRGGIVMIAAALALTACTIVDVQVPPEVNLQAAGIKTVAVLAEDMPDDPSPVALLLRAEATQQMRRLLPTIEVVEDPQGADAVLRMAVANHGIGTPYFQTTQDAQGRLSCEAWQDTVLIVDTAVFRRGDAAAAWEAVLEKHNRIDLSCVPRRGPSWIAQTPAPTDPQLVGEVVTELGNRLAGYTRKELRRK